MSKDKCFHCNLPIISTPPPSLVVLGEKQVFCCHGCKAVCEVIVSSGNADYYKHREGSARTFNADELPELLDKLKLYDNKDIQRDFVRTDKNKDWKEVWLILEEIRCAACMWLNERTLRSLEGILDVQMDYTGQQARVRWNPEKIKLSEILAAITNIGYVAHPFDPTQREALNKEQKDRSIQRIIFALILGMGVMQSAIGSYFFTEVDEQGNLPLWLQISRWVNVASTFLLLAYPGQIFFKNAWRDLKNKSLGMDVPIVIGLSVAWLGSLYTTIIGVGEVYFESIAMFVIFLLIARYIELRARITATTLLDRSSKIIPKTAQLILQSGLKETPVIELVKGDVIQVSPGETLAVDGRLLSEKSSFNESLLTGESLPVMHSKGDKLLGGSINVDQLIEVEVISGKIDSSLNEIHQLTQKSTMYRPYYIDIAESIAGKFVAVILLIASATFLFWTFAELNSSFNTALSHMISVLIVTCPCALALAAPVALSLGAAGLNHLHVLSIKMSSIEKLKKVDTIVFDKTGTLTTGEPALKQIKLLGEIDEEHALVISAELEKGSKHPFAKAIIAAAKKIDDKELNIKASKNYLGLGIEGSIKLNGKDEKWRLGSASFVNLEKNDLKDEIKKEIEGWLNLGYSTIYLSNDVAVQAVFCIHDPLRSGVKQFLDVCEELGIKRKVILSGDHQKSVNAIAKQLGITEAYGGLSPQDKLNWVKSYHAHTLKSEDKESKDRKVMMLGDGINDAPTLAAADVSMTFSDATDLAQSNCDFILLGKNYNTLGSAFQLMNKTRNIIIQNLGWAILYNIVAVPAAVLGYVTPWMAAIGMSLSSLLVVLNSLRLKKLQTDNKDFKSDFNDEGTYKSAKKGERVL